MYTINVHRNTNTNAVWIASTILSSCLVFGVNSLWLLKPLMNGSPIKGVFWSVKIEALSCRWKRKVWRDETESNLDPPECIALTMALYFYCLCEYNSKFVSGENVETVPQWTKLCNLLFQSRCI